MFDALRRIAFGMNRNISDDHLYDAGYRLYVLGLRLESFLNYGRTDMFTEIHIETSSMCNRRCTYCPVSIYPRKRALMKRTVFEKIIRELARIGYKGAIYHHMFNEPLMDPRLPDLVRFESAHLPYSKVWIMTNGDLLNSKMMDKLVEAGVHGFNVTVHEGRSDFPGMLRRFRSDQKRRISIRRMDKDSRLMTRGGLVKPVHRDIRRICGYPTLIMLINHEGKAVLCCEDFFGKYSFGDVAKESVMDIWNKPGYRKVRDDTLNGRFILPICRNCI